MEASTLETSYRMKSQEKANMCGQMARPTLETGRETRCMVREPLNGAMVRSTRESSRMIRDKARECSPGEMEESMMDNGQMESNTEEVPLSRWMAQGRWVSGKMEEIFAGSMRMSKKALPLICHLEIWLRERWEVLQIIA